MFKKIYEDNDISKPDNQRLSDDARNFHNYVIVVNRTFELQGRKVHIDVANAIATRIIRDGFTIEQLENAEKMMAGHRFVQLGYPEFLQYLPAVSSGDGKTFCDFCGDEQTDSGKKIAQGMLPALCVKRDEFRGTAVGETRILCSCDRGKKSQRLWAAMPRYDDKKVFKAGHKWYFVFTMDDENWLEKQWKIKDYLQEEIDAKFDSRLDLDSEEIKQKFEGFFARAEEEIKKKKLENPQPQKINLINTFQKIVDDNLGI
jgi:hypothetical protein